MEFKSKQESNEFSTVIHNGRDWNVGLDEKWSKASLCAIALFIQMDKSTLKDVFFVRIQIICFDK